MSFTAGTAATGQTSTAFGTDLTLSVPDGTWTSGKVLVMKYSQRGSTISSITDPRSNTWVLKNSVGSNASDGGLSPCFAYTIITNSYSAADSITVTGTGNGARSAALSVYSAGGAIAFDQFVEGTTSQTFGTSMVAGTVTTPSAALVIVGFAIDTNQTTLSTPPTGYTGETGVSNTSSRGIISAYKAQSASGTETTPTASVASSTDSMGATITFTETVASFMPKPARFTLQAVRTAANY